MDVCYTVGIKRRFLPGYRKFKVTSHEWLRDGAERMVAMVLDGGGYISVSMWGRELKVYPDYDRAKWLMDRAAAEAEAAKAQEDEIRTKIRKEIEDQVLTELKQLQQPKVGA